MLANNVEGPEQPGGAVDEGAEKAEGEYSGPSGCAHQQSSVAERHPQGQGGKHATSKAKVANTPSRQVDASSLTSSTASLDLLC